MIRLDDLVRAPGNIRAGLTRLLLGFWYVGDEPLIHSVLLLRLDPKQPLRGGLEAQRRGVRIVKRQQEHGVVESLPRQERYVPVNFSNVRVKHPVLEEHRILRVARCLVAPSRLLLRAVVSSRMAPRHQLVTTTGPMQSQRHGLGRVLWPWHDLFGLEVRYHALRNLRHQSTSNWRGSI